MYQNLFWLWRKYLIFAFFFFAFHLIRDIFQDILNIETFFTRVLHYEPAPERLPSHMKWLLFGGYRKWITFPMEIFALIVIPIILKRSKTTWLDWILVLIFIFWIMVWLLARYYAIN